MERCPYHQPLQLTHILAVLLSYTKRRRSLAKLNLYPFLSARKRTRRQERTRRRKRIITRVVQYALGCSQGFQSANVTYVAATDGRNVAAAVANEFFILHLQGADHDKPSIMTLKS